MRLLHVLALAAPFRHVLAVGGTPGNPADLAKQYRINFDTNDNGGCKGYQDLLQNSYGEAFSAAKAAEDSLAFFLADPRPQQRQDPTGFARWVRIGKAFVALFGVSNMPGAIKKDVAHSFNVMQSDIPSLAFFQPEIGVPASIYCSSSWVKALRPTDADPTDPQNRPLSETRPAAVNGVYYSIPDNRLTSVDTNPVFGELCGPGNLAFTMRGFSAITFCPDTLNGKTSVKASIAAEKNTINLGDPIGNHRTMAEMWIHEWHHLLANGRDFNAVDSQGKPKLLADGSTDKVYGWDNVANLGRFRPLDVLESPDAHAIFANVIFYDNFAWAFGIAAALS